MNSPYVADPANPTDAELAAAIDRGLADGSLITAEDFLARVAEDDADQPLGKPGKAIVTDTIVPSKTHAFKIGGRWYWVVEIVDTLSTGSQFVMTVPVAKDPRYALIGRGKLRYIQTGRESFQVRAQTPPRWGWVTLMLRCNTVGCKNRPAEIVRYDWRNDGEFVTEKVCTTCADSYGRRPVITHYTRRPIG
jgi:hypothetical protein